MRRQQAGHAVPRARGGRLSRRELLGRLALLGLGSSTLAPAAGMIASSQRLDAQEAAMTVPMKKLFVDGVWLWYEERGAGVPIVLVHGEMADLRVWFNQIEPFSRVARVIAYSRRYSWPGTPPGEEADASVARQVEDLAALIKRLSVGPVHLVGHSYGGALALSLALQHPELLRSLVVAEPVVFSVLASTPEAGQDLQANLDFRSGVLGPALLTDNTDRIVKTFVGYVSPGAFDRLPPDVQAMYYANVPAFRAELAARGFPFSCNDAGRIKTPTLVLASDTAPGVYRRASEAVAHCIAGGSLVTLPQTTHLLQLDDPEAFNEAVLGFVAKH
jgi:non-heme chloroperoxidase